MRLLQKIHDILNEFLIIFKDLHRIIKEEFERRQQVEEEKVAKVSIEAYYSLLEARVTELEKQVASLSKAESAETRTGPSIPECIFLYRYVFYEMGLDKTELNKTKIARLIGLLTGKSENCLRQELSKLPDDKRSKKMAEKFEPQFRPLFPEIADKMKNDYKNK